ncbi:MAG: hypothetical protein AAF823_02480 [Planctomycetota bacterium]
MPTPVDLHKPEQRFSAQGSLPRGWSQRSGWQSDLSIRLEPVEVQGRRGLRASKAGEGEVQLMIATPVIEPGRYRLIITGRNPDQLNVIAGIRQIGPGYLWSYRTQFTFGDEWQREQREFTLNRRMEDSGFFIRARGPSGAIDLAEFSLQRITPQRVMAELRSKHPDGGPANLFRSTTLDQGLPEGWTVFGRGYYGLDTRMEVVEDAAAPSGIGRVLELESPSEVIPLNTEPFAVIQRDRPHTLSFFHEGEGRWEVEVRYDGDKQVVPGPSFTSKPGVWQRYSMTFDPEVFRDRGHVQVRGKGRIRVDAFQLEPGEQATPYARAEANEVSLALTNGVHPRAAVLTGAETPAALSLGVTRTATSPAILRLRQHDVYGNAHELLAIPLPTHSSDVLYQAQEVVVPPPTDRPFGAFRVEAWIESNDGVRQSPMVERVYVRVPEARYAGRDAPESSFGAHFRPADWNAALLKAVGVNWVRLHDQGVHAVAWSFLEPEPGQWTFRDDLIEVLRHEDLSILGVLSTTPIWAASIENPEDMTEADQQRYFAKYFLPRDPADWRNYVSTLADRYRDDIRVYDLWNEPWGGGFMNIRFNPDNRNKGMFQGPPHAERVVRYLDLGRHARDALNSVDPDIQLVVDISKTNYLERSIELGFTEFADVLAIHRYVGGTLGFPGDTFAAESAQQIAAAPELGLPLWMTEGSSTHLSHRSGFLDHTLAGVRIEENPVATAQQLSRYLLSNLANRVEKVFLYAATYSHFAETNTRWGVLLMEGGAPHPSAAAHAAFARHIDGKQIAVDRRIGGLHAYAFTETNGSTTVVLSDLPGESHGLDASAWPGAVDVFGNGLVDGEPIYFPVFILTDAEPGAALDAVARAIRR